MKPISRSSRPFSPALIGLSGVVVGMCLVTLSYVFVRDTWPDMMPSGVSMTTFSTSSSPSNVFANTTSPGTSGSLTNATTTSAILSASAERSFQALPLRFIAAFNDTKGLYTYFVATDRTEIIKNGDSFQSEANDTACGSIYTQPNCYLLRESRYAYGADPRPKLVASWSGPGAFDETTEVTFTGSGQERFMEFTTSEGPANCTDQAKHKINLTTGQDTVTIKEATRASCES